MYAEHCCYYLIHTALVCIAVYEYTFNDAQSLLCVTASIRQIVSAF